MPIHVPRSPKTLSFSYQKNREKEKLPPVVVHRMGAGMQEETIRTSLGKYMD